MSAIQPVEYNDFQTPFAFSDGDSMRHEVLKLRSVHREGDVLTESLENHPDEVGVRVYTHDGKPFPADTKSDSYHLQAKPDSREKKLKAITEEFSNRPWRGRINLATAKAILNNEEGVQCRGVELVEASDGLVRDLDLQRRYEWAQNPHGGKPTHQGFDRYFENLGQAAVGSRLVRISFTKQLPNAGDERRYEGYIPDTQFRPTAAAENALLTTYKIAEDIHNRCNAIVEHAQGGGGLVGGYLSRVVRNGSLTGTPQVTEGHMVQVRSQLRDAQCQFHAEVARMLIDNADMRTGYVRLEDKYIAQGLDPALQKFRETARSIHTVLGGLGRKVGHREWQEVFS